MEYIKGVLMVIGLLVLGFLIGVGVQDEHNITNKTPIEKRIVVEKKVDVIKEIEVIKIIKVAPKVECKLVEIK